MSNTKLYLVGRYPSEINDSTEGLMMFCGVYTTEELAIENCFDDKHFFVTFELNAPNTVEDQVFEVVTIPTANWVSKKLENGNMKWVNWKK